MARKKGKTPKKNQKNNFHFGTCCALYVKRFSALLYIFFLRQKMKMGRRDDVKILRSTLNLLKNMYTMIISDAVEVDGKERREKGIFCRVEEFFLMKSLELSEG